MREFTESEKQIMNSDSCSVDVELRFPSLNLSIRNDKIYSESLSMEESLIEGDTIQFGKCNAACFKIKVADFDTDIINKVLEVYLKFTDNTNNRSFTYRFGTYTVFSAEKTADRMWKDIVAYDNMTKFDIDITEQYKKLYEEDGTMYTVRELLNYVCSFAGISTDGTTTSKNYENANIRVGKTIEPTTLSARAVLQNICEILGVFGRINEDGKLEFIDFRQTFLYPRKGLYPHKGLYPSGNEYDSKEDITVYKNCDFKDFKTDRFDSVAIRMEADDIGVLYSNIDDPQNVYTITSNILTYGKSSEELTTIAKNVFKNYSNFQYVPAQTTIEKGLELQLGSVYDCFVKIPRETDVLETKITSYVLNRKISGIQAISSVLTAQGIKTKQDYLQPITSEFMNLQGKYNKAINDAEGYRREMGDIAKGLTTKIDETAEGIDIQMTDLQRNLEGQITASAEGLENKFKETYTTKEYLQELGISGENLLLRSDLNNPLFNDMWELHGATIDNERGVIVFDADGYADFKCHPRMELEEDYTFSCLGLYYQQGDGQPFPPSTMFELHYDVEGMVVPEILYGEIPLIKPSITFKPKAQYLKYIRVYGSYVDGWEVPKFKLEKGKQATSWSPAPSDSTTGQINALREEFESDIKQTAREIKQTVAQTSYIYKEVDEQGNPITVKFYAYGIPELNTDVWSGLQKTDDIYLDMETGQTYKYGRTSWSSFVKLELITNTIQSEIDELPNEIGLKVEDGKDNTSAILNISVKDGKGQVKTISAEIRFKGYVTFESLEGDGTTEINGNNIIAGIIKSKDYHDGDIEYDDDGNIISGSVKSGIKFDLDNRRIQTPQIDIADDYINIQGYSTIGRRGQGLVGVFSFAQGIGNVASGVGSHASGLQTVASGDFSKTSGSFTKASGDNSVAEGYQTQAIAPFSHASGFHTITSRESQYVVGRFNKESNSLFVVGNGNNETDRRNAFEVDANGNIIGGGYKEIVGAWDNAIASTTGNTSSIINVPAFTNGNFDSDFVEKRSNNQIRFKRDCLVTINVRLAYVSQSANNIGTFDLYKNGSKQTQYSVQQSTPTNIYLHIMQSYTIPFKANDTLDFRCQSTIANHKTNFQISNISIIKILG